MDSEAFLKLTNFNKKCFLRFMIERLIEFENYQNLYYPHWLYGKNFLWVQ